MELQVSDFILKKTTRQRERDTHRKKENVCEDFPKHLCKLFHDYNALPLSDRVF